MKKRMRYEMSIKTMELRPDEQALARSDARLGWIYPAYDGVVETIMAKLSGIRNMR